MHKGSRRFGLQARLFVVDPWTIISQSIRASCPSASIKEATASIEQARDYYAAAVFAGIVAARPLLLYYSFMNLAKALLLTRGVRATYDRARHGLAEGLKPTNRELDDAFLKAFPSPSSTGTINLFSEFLASCGGSGIPAATQYDLPLLLPQIVPGHRLWAEAANQDERFIAIHEIALLEDRRSKSIWLRMYMFRDDLNRLRKSPARLLREAGLAGLFRHVKSSGNIAGRAVLAFEQVKPLSYTHRAADEVQRLVAQNRELIWATVTGTPPYRRYYLYCAPLTEHTVRLPQLASAYAISYYLGSITRYRPHHFDEIVAADFGPFVHEFISSQPAQFLYLMASEFASREVTRASLV
jgi:hypothetical protein